MASTQSYEAANLFNVKGLVAVITGGGTGLGLMTALALAANGAHKVFIIGRRLEPLEKAAKQAPHGNIFPVQGDVSSKESLAAAAKKVKEEVGYINVLFANSGISGPGLAKDLPQDREPTAEEFASEYWKTSMEDFTNTFDVNISGVWFTSLAFLSLLAAGNEKGNMAQQRSQIIATSSIASFTRRPFAGYAYSASKAGVTHLIKNMATTFTPFKIRCNVLAPGLYPSEMTSPDGWPEGSVTISRDRIPEERSGSGEDIAGTMLYLCSRAGAYCNGMVAVTDGGRMSIIPATY